MTIPTTPVTRVMDGAAGASYRYQLDAILGSLEMYDNPAAQAGDTDVIALIARLHEARQAASRIETRVLASVLYRGVRLVRDEPDDTDRKPTDSAKDPDHLAP